MSSPNLSLISPSSDTPWDVKVVSVVPKKVHLELEKIGADSPLVGAATEGWAAVLLAGKLFVWHVTDSMDAPQNVQVLFHAKMAPPAVMKISITPTNTSSNDVVFVHAASTDGHLYLWKLSKNDKSSIARSPHARANLHLDAGEEVTALQSQGNLLVVGTSYNSLWWCKFRYERVFLSSLALSYSYTFPFLPTGTPTSHPIMLHAQKVERQQGFLSRIIYGSSGASLHETIHSIQVLSPKVFLSISTNGNLEQWKATTTIASSHQATFEGTTVASLPSLLNASGRMDDSSVRSIDVLRTSLFQRFLDLVVKIDEKRIYWIRGIVTQTSSLKLEHVQWLNRFHPEVSCVGLVATSHGNTAYATFQYPSTSGGPVTCCALSAGQVSEVDMPETQVPRWIDGTLGRDVVTFGTWGLATSGLGIRTRFLGELQQDTDASASSLLPTTASSRVHTFALHLRSAFWQWYKHGGTFRLPPSIVDASTEELEAAILLTAQYLQTHETAAKHNPSEWHLSFLKMLQQGGLYRSISHQGRWALLGIGQELAVLQALHGKVVCKGDSVSKALAEVRDWRILSLALETANEFRKEYASSRYDAMTGASASHRVWTSDGTLQAVMWRQLEEWSESCAANELPKEQVKTVVTTALTSHQEASDPKTYEEVKELAISLIRKIHDDPLAFELSKQHSWNDGLCQLARDHEKEEEYKLDGLMQSRGNDFCDYLLQWHADKGLPAHVLNYGRNCPDRLAALLEKDDRLSQYRWIAAIRAKKFDQASDLLMETEGKTLNQARRALSIGKLASRKRRKIVDRRLELVKAQELLLGNVDEELLSPERLLSLALDKMELETHVPMEDKVQTAVIALAIAGASEDRIRLAAQVWSACIVADRDRWMEWLQTQDDMEDAQLREIILETTLFGALWQAVQGEHDTDVLYGNVMDTFVLERLGIDGALGAMQMRRLLGFVTTPVDS